MTNFKKLSRKEMKNVLGGDDGKAGCCYLQRGKSPICGLTKKEARAMYALAADSGVSNPGWCCASC